MINLKRESLYIMTQYYFARLTGIFIFDYTPQKKEQQVILILSQLTLYLPEDLDLFHPVF